MKISMQVDPSYFVRSKQRINALRSNPQKTIWAIGDYIKDLAMAYAPKSTGALASGVISRHLKNKVNVYAFDPLHRVDGNALAAWVDRKFPFQYGNKRQKVWMKNQTVVYGGTGLLKSGKQAVWTGEVEGDAGYFTLAVRQGKRQLRENMASSVKSAIAGIEV